MSSIAIIQTAFIGDVILATPLFEAAKASSPGDRIVAVVRNGCDSIVANNPHVDEILVWDKHGGERGVRGVFRMAARLKSLGIHTALVPHRSLRSAAAAYLSGAKTRIGFDRGAGKFLHSARVEYRYGIHEVERNLMLAERAGWQSAGFSPALFPDDMDRTIVNDFVSEAGKYCVFAPGSVWATKQWPADYYVETGKAMVSSGLTVFVSGGLEDEAVCSSVAGRIPGAQSTCGLMGIRQSAELYRRAEFVLTGDTAPQHIASAMGAKVFALFGPTVRDFGFWPYSVDAVMIEEDIRCRPCGAHGHRVCPEKHHHCMIKITPDRVISLIREWMENP